MIPNRQSPAYALFARRPSCQRRRMSSLRNYPPARNRPAVRYRRHCRHRVPASRACGSKSEGNISTAHGGCGANFECLRETKYLSAHWPTGAERKGRIRRKRRKRRTLHPAPLARPCYRPVTMAWSLVFAAAAAYGLFQTARGLAYRHGRSPRCRRRRHYASASPGTRAFRRC
jgi:hypothetical protein